MTINGSAIQKTSEKARSKLVKITSWTSPGNVAMISVFSVTPAIASGADPAGRWSAPGSSA